MVCTVSWAFMSPLLGSSHASRVCRTTSGPCWIDSKNMSTLIQLAEFSFPVSSSLVGNQVLCWCASLGFTTANPHPWCRAGLTSRFAGSWACHRKPEARSSTGAQVTWETPLLRDTPQESWEPGNEQPGDTLDIPWRYPSVASLGHYVRA